LKNSTEQAQSFCVTIAFHYTCVRIIQTRVVRGIGG
jgi:hypothetical protein